MLDWIKSQLRYLRQDVDGPKWTDIFIVFIAFLSLFATCGFSYWGIRDAKIATINQAKLTQESNNINRDAFMSVQRAFLFVSGVEIQPITVKGEKQVQITPKWENGGNTPANPVYLEIRCPITMENADKLKLKSLSSPAGQGLVSPPIPISKAKAVFGPKQILPVNGCTPTMSQLDLLSPYKPHVNVYAIAVYRDVFKDSPMHITESCTDIKILKNTDGYMFSEGPCTNFNCADDQCPEEDRMAAENEYFNRQ